MRRSVPVATAATLVLVLLGTPFLGVRFGTVDDRALPAESTSRAVSEQLRRDFAANEGDAFPVVAADAGSGTVLSATMTATPRASPRRRQSGRRREEGLRVPPRHHKRARVCSSTTPADGLAATSPDHVRALDYQFDVTATGRVIKILHVVDEFTRESLSDLVEHSIDADATVATLEKIVCARATRSTVTPVPQPA